MANTPIIDKVVGKETIKRMEINEAFMAQMGVKCLLQCIQCGTIYNNLEDLLEHKLIGCNNEHSSKRA